MKKKYIIGIDGGSQSTKITVFDLTGRIVCQAREPLRACVTDDAGHCEHPGDDLWDAFIAASHALLKQFTGSMDEVAGIGLCTIRSCRAFLRADGALAQPVMSWLDCRAFGPIHAGDEVRYVTTTTGYFTHRLTGNFADTTANNTRAQWPVDPETWDWTGDEARYKELNITRERLVSLQMPGTVLGYLTHEAAEASGFAEGLPVIATGNDKSVEALGSGLLDTGAGLVSLGTYITSMVYSSVFVENAKHFFGNFSSIPNVFVCESDGIWRGMWTVSWLVQLLGDEVKRKADAEGISPEEYLGREAAKVPAGSEGLMAVMEWLMPYEVAHKKGMFIGFDVRHTRAHMFRALMEGIAMTMHKNFTAMCEELSAKPGRIILSGGGAASPLFAQIFADVFGLPVVRNEIIGAAGLGAAICTAVGTGVYPDFETAAANMVRVRDVFTPDAKAHALYTRINDEVYSRLSAATDPLLKRMQTILEEQ